MFGWEFPPFNSGGLGVACQGLSKSLAERGFDVLFVMPKRLDISSPYARMIFAEQEGIETIPFDSALSPYLSSKSYVRARGQGDVYGPDLMAEVARYASTGGRIAGENSFDVIYAHDWLSFGAAMQAQKVSGKPLIVHVHATEFDRAGGASGVNPYVYMVEKDGMEAASCVIAVSEMTRQIIIEKYGIAPEKVRVVHNGIDESTMPSGESARNLLSLKQAGYKIVLFLGRLTLQKGPDYFLRAAKRVIEKDPKVLFVISGSGDMETQVLEMTAELGLTSNVIFTGFLSGADRHDMYTAADLFVMPSVSEPFGITPLESMKLGTPVLISKQSGVSEVVKHALKVDFWDIDDMAAKILAVVENPALGETMSLHARSEADRLTWADAAFKVDNIVHEFVS